VSLNPFKSGLLHLTGQLTLIRIELKSKMELFQEERERKRGEEERERGEEDKVRKVKRRGEESV
jgi:hypothetical protein